MKDEREPKGDAFLWRYFFGSRAAGIENIRRYWYVGPIGAGAAVVVALWFFFFGFGSLNHEEVRLTFYNHTESVLCYYPSREDALAGGCSAKVRPLRETDWLPGCGYGPHADELPMTVALTTEDEGRLLYQRTEECRVWQRSNRKFIIEQRGGDFVVTDPVADTPPPSP
jgi:hypothetical protein